MAERKKKKKKKELQTWMASLICVEVEIRIEDREYKRCTTGLCIEYVSNNSKVAKERERER